MRAAVFVEGVVDMKLPRETVLIGHRRFGEPFGNGPQSETFRGHMLLSLDVRGPHNQRQASQSGVVQAVVLNNRLEAASLAAMIQLHLWKARCVERRRSALLCQHEQALF